MRLRKLYTSCMIAKQKQLPDIFILLGVSTTMQVVHIEYGKSHQSKPIGLACAVFIELFTAHLSEKTIKILSFSQAEILKK